MQLPSRAQNGACVREFAKLFGKLPYSATSAGLRRLAEDLMEKVAEKEAHFAMRFQSWREDVFRWLLQLPPDQDEAWSELNSELRVLLDEGGYEWLKSLAIYPGLRWDITLYLGLKLKDSKGQPLFNEDRASRLCLLPWFSRGLIPRWIRLRLINALPQICKKQATELILNLLSQAQEREPSPHEHLITLPVAISDARPGQKNKDGQRVDLAVAAGDALFIDLVSNSGGGSLIAPPEVLTRLGQGTHEQKRRHAWLDWAIALALPFYFGGLAYLFALCFDPKSSLTLYLERKGGEPIPAVDVIKAEGSLSVEGVHLRVSPKGLTADLPKVAFEKASSAEYLKELFRRYRVLDARTKSTRIVLVVEPLFVQANDVEDRTSRPGRETCSSL